MATRSQIRRKLGPSPDSAALRTGILEHLSQADAALKAATKLARGYRGKADSHEAAEELLSLADHYVSAAEETVKSFDRIQQDGPSAIGARLGALVVGQCGQVLKIVDEVEAILR